jgi:hypothetical protein
MVDGEAIVDLARGWYADRFRFFSKHPLASFHAAWGVTCLQRVKDTLRIPD